MYQNEDIQSTNKTKEFFYKLSRLLYIIWSPNFWFEDVNFSDTSIKIHDKVSFVLTIMHFLLMTSEIAAFFTQNNLTDKQKNDRLILSYSHPIMYLELLGLYYHKNEIKEVLKTFSVEMKKVYNDLEIESEMIRKAKFCSIAYAIFTFGCLVSYGIDGLQQAITTEGTFTTIIPAWPDVHDNTMLAGTVRVIMYVTWWTLLIRVDAVYITTICLMTCLSHQYKHTESYFYSLNGIFENETMSQEEKEKVYEKRLKVGIMFHSDTLKCTAKCEKITNYVYGGHIIMNVSVLALLMVQMTYTERTLVTMYLIVVTGLSVLVTTAVVMLNAGNVTEEASLLSNAIFYSGWHNCTGEALARVKGLLLVAIAQSQKPVILKCLRIVPISYPSFLQILKTTYSLFSVLY